MLHKLIMRSECTFLLIAASILLASCGGLGGGDPTALDGMSANQAESFAKTLSLAASSSMGSSSFKEATISNTLLPLEVQEKDPLWKSVDSVSCNQTATSCLVNQPITASRSCTSGGSINVTGSISGTMNNLGTSLLLINATETILDWRCQPPLVINGDPYISLSGQFSFINMQPSTQQHVTINGGIKWGTSAAQSCQIHLDTNFNRSGGGHTTGMVCNHAIDITF